MTDASTLIERIEELNELAQEMKSDTDLTGGVRELAEQHDRDGQTLNVGDSVVHSMYLGWGQGTIDSFHRDRGVVYAHVPDFPGAADTVQIRRIFPHRLVRVDTQSPERR